MFYELEIHEGIALIILDNAINFEMQLWDAVDYLGHISSNQKTIDDREFLFVDLKLNLSSAASMGRDEENNRLAYVYCAQNIDHLLA